MEESPGPTRTTPRGEGRGCSARSARRELQAPPPVRRGPPPLGGVGALPNGATRARPRGSGGGAAVRPLSPRQRLRGGGGGSALPPEEARDTRAPRPSRGSAHLRALRGAAAAGGAWVAASAASLAPPPRSCRFLAAKRGVRARPPRALARRGSAAVHWRTRRGRRQRGSGRGG